MLNWIRPKFIPARVAAARLLQLAESAADAGRHGE